MKRTAQAQWRGDLKSGEGKLSTASGTLSSSLYSFHTRLEQGKAPTRKSSSRRVSKVPGVTQEAFDRAVAAAKTGCPVSKLFQTNITLNA